MLRSLLLPALFAAAAAQGPRRLFAQMRKDPHLHLPHGGRADFRGQDNTVFNLLSAKDVAFNVLFEAADFAWATRLVHGTKMQAAYWTLRTESGKVITIEYKAERYANMGIVHEEGHMDVLVRPEQPAVTIDDVTVGMLSHKTLSIDTKKWRFLATSTPFPFGKFEENKDKVLLDVAIQPKYDADADAVAPHGIIGQSYDGDSFGVDGKMDTDKSGESTTVAQAEGAIEGTWEDYIVATPFATDFKYSRFDASAAPHRDVSKLSGAKKASDPSAVGTSLSGAISINLATAAATAFAMSGEAGPDSGPSRPTKRTRAESAPEPVPAASTAAPAAGEDEKVPPRFQRPASIPTPAPAQGMVPAPVAQAA